MPDGRELQLYTQCPRKYALQGKYGKRISAKGMVISELKKFLLNAVTDPPTSSTFLSLFQRAVAPKVERLTSVSDSYKKSLLSASKYSEYVTWFYGVFIDDDKYRVLDTNKLFTVAVSGTPVTTSIDLIVEDNETLRVAFVNLMFETDEMKIAMYVNFDSGSYLLQENLNSIVYTDKAVNKLLIFNCGDGKIYTPAPSDRNKLIVADKVSNAIEGIAAEKFPMRDGFWCQSCKYISECLLGSSSEDDEWFPSDEIDIF